MAAGSNSGLKGAALRNLQQLARGLLWICVFAVSGVFHLLNLEKLTKPRELSDHLSRQDVSY
jgi:hypothetical protein